MTFCMQEIETCGRYGANGTGYTCPSCYKLLSNATNITNPSSTTCCEWIPTCAELTRPAGASFNCSIGTKMLEHGHNVTNISSETCCVSNILVKMLSNT